MFLMASYLPTDDPSRVATIADRLAEVPDHVILNGWAGMMAFDAGPVVSKVEVSLPLHRLRPAPS